MILVQCCAPFLVIWHWQPPNTKLYHHLGWSIFSDVLQLWNIKISIFYFHALHVSSSSSEHNYTISAFAPISHFCDVKLTICGYFCRLHKYFFSFFFYRTTKWVNGRIIFKMCSLSGVLQILFLTWYPKLEDISWYDANIMPPFQDLAGDWVLERFRHVAMRVCGVQQRFLLRRDPSARIGVCDPSARIGGGSLWTRRNLISLDPLMLLGNPVLFSCELNPFDSISTLAVLSSKPFFAIRHPEMRPLIGWFQIWLVDMLSGIRQN